MLEENQRRLAWIKKEQQAEHEKDKQIVQEMIANEEKNQRQREAEFKTRLDRIQLKMAKMADTVVKNERDKQLKEERRLLALQSEKERREIQDENDRKNRLFSQNKVVQH